MASANLRRRSLNVTLGSMLAAVAALSLLIVLLNLYILAVIKGHAAAMNLTSRGPVRLYQLLYAARQAASSNGPEREAALAEARDAVTQMDRRFVALRRGDPATGVPPTRDPRLVADLANREEQWTRELRPAFERVLAMPPGAEALQQLIQVERSARDLIRKAENTVDLYHLVDSERIALFRTIQFVLLAIVVLTAIVAYRVSRTISARAQALATTAEAIAGGQLALQAPVSGNDELTQLGDSFNSMTANLRATIENEQAGRQALEKLMRAVDDTVNSLTSASAEILAATTQQSTGTQEQAAAVAETVTTVDEVLQTSDQAAQRARMVAESAQRSLEISRSGRKAVDETVAVIGTVNRQTESVAETILSLAERAQAIGEIIATVNEIAEQTNILALNAAIEASRAGEQGRGFAVVAGEVKTLAGQSKKATAQVRRILGEIQSGTNSAVMAAEEGKKSVSTAMQVVYQAGETIRSLSETIAEAAQSAGQIAASAGQQVTGMSQIHQAMRNINIVTSQNLAATRQTEQAAQDLNALAGGLKQLLSSYNGQQEAQR